MTIRVEIKHCDEQSGHKLTVTKKTPKYRTDSDGTTIRHATIVEPLGEIEPGHTSSFYIWGESILEVSEA